MNCPSSPNPSSIEYEELFKFDETEFDFQKIMEEMAIGPEDHSLSPALSWTSSEKFMAPEVTSSAQTSLANSPMSSELEDKDGMKKRKRNKNDLKIHQFKTRSIESHIEDGYKWRKYGKKPIRGNPFPRHYHKCSNPDQYCLIMWNRHYHKCSNPDCVVKKQIQRDINNPEYVLTTYEGIHNHSIPSVVYCDLDELDLKSHNNWCFETNLYSFSHSAPN